LIPTCFSPRSWLREAALLDRQASSMVMGSELRDFLRKVRRVVDELSQCIEVPLRFRSILKRRSAARTRSSPLILVSMTSPSETATASPGRRS
jgi:hypothetical protein